tara:strand:+ start:3217 stop:3456 length:240 start_codon:yes stop_codon:yes gene_type:complete
MNINGGERRLIMFDPNKTYSAVVWDMPIAVVDIEADDYVRNEDGTIKLFDMPNYDYSYICDDVDVNDLHERDEGDDYDD